MKQGLILLWVLAIVACQDNTETLDVSVNDNDNVTNLIDMTITPEKAAVLAQVFRTDLLTQPGSTRAGDTAVCSCCYLHGLRHWGPVLPMCTHTHLTSNRWKSENMHQFEKTIVNSVKL